MDVTKMSQEQMFCYQCEQTFQGKGCTVMGVCGKNPEVATLQDLLVYVLRGVSQLQTEAAKVGINDENVSVFTSEALFATLTNVNFDPEGIMKYLSRAVELRDRLRAKIVSKGGHVPSPGGPATLVLEKT